jgi:DNA polymerase III gamma/tau subunit
MMDLNKKLRPTKLDDVLGQEKTIKSIKNMLKKGAFPHASIFYGHTGTGKTTTARIVKDELGCIGHDFHEINAAETRGIDDVREWKRSMAYYAKGKCKVYLIDEAHMLTREASNALLKMTEEPGDSVYFMFCTTQFDKMIPTLVGRSQHFQFRPLDAKQLTALIQRSGGKGLSKSVQDSIVQGANGSARNALFLLEKCLSLDGEEEQLAGIDGGDAPQEMRKLFQAMLRGARFNECLALLKDIKEEPETIRKVSLFYFSACMGSPKIAPKCAHFLECFQYFYTEMYGRPGLILSLWNACQGK